MKVWTDEDLQVHYKVCQQIIGSRGKRIKKLKSKTKLNFTVTANKVSDHLLVSGTNAEEVNIAVGEIKNEIARIRESLQTEVLFEKVFTDDDADIHNSICKLFIGKGGQTFDKFFRKTGIDFHVDTKEHGYITVSGSEAVIKIAVEKVKEEVDRIRTEVIGRFSENVPTDPDNSVHADICRIFIGKDGENIKRLLKETGNKFEIYSHRGNQFVVSGTDGEMLKDVVEKVREEVDKIRKHVRRQTAVTKQIFTDKDADVHQSIFSTIIGRNGQNLKTLELDSEVNFGQKYDPERGEHFLTISGVNDEVVKQTVETLTEEVETVRRFILSSVSKKVITPGNDEECQKIFANIIGKSGVNIERLRLETGTQFDIYTRKGENALYVVVTDAEDLGNVAEKVTQEVDRILLFLQTPIIKKVPTDTNDSFHNRICRKLIGTKGKNIKRLILESGLIFELDVTEKGHVLVSGTDDEMVNLAVERVKQEVKNIKHAFNTRITERVYTDEDYDFHQKITGAFLGTKGENIKRLMSEIGHEVEIQVHKFRVGYFLVHGSDCAEVILAADKVAKEIKRIKKELDLD
ncbi:uncharacterized protein LOC132562973 [Ylistrum balloti]|uniref:uncharacterized protein LOC132562973 n=1 Tax=Ylistrum balloti TaxID=509963 RepID=UPI002905829B|nr:uncharacterized protein LOC132562973 [Ylistrum balloti]